MKNIKKLIKIFFLAVIFLLIFLIFLLIIKFNLVAFGVNLFKSPELIIIEDDCGTIMNNLIHEIKSEENCRLRCINECGLFDKNFVRVEFVQNNNSCNECNCYCK